MMVVPVVFGLLEFLLTLDRLLLWVLADLACEVAQQDNEAHIQRQNLEHRPHVKSRRQLQAVEHHAVEVGNLQIDEHADLIKHEAAHQV